MAEVTKKETEETVSQQQVPEEAEHEVQLEEDQQPTNGTDEGEDQLAGEPEEVDEKEERIRELETKLQEQENKLLRVLADFENAKRRATLDKEALNKYKAQSLLTNLLPVLDNFERALAVEVKAEETQSLLTGMEMIYRNLMDSLKGEGLIEIEAQDQEFDPNFHQAVMTDSDPDKASGIVLQELQKGYMLKDRVLRPTMVKVNE
ncbi:nucleotide exchange factor GrpE [Sporosarcina saromensis]|uniref:Protein GrpE n=1 Tax=Sporosarcina saromensis TaxID=359365 RepID=A0ABU4G5R8_9BACL|nr:nucleotide exchange factor GrpE [Sporosarcina saromensis]MDW0112305.1 nucleotide exchange factor GrpE [Sporosarcina saromensis]